MLSFGKIVKNINEIIPNRFKCFTLLLSMRNHRHILSITIPFFGSSLQSIGFYFSTLKYESLSPALLQPPLQVLRKALDADVSFPPYPPKKQPSLWNARLNFSNRFPISWAYRKIYII
jgi:hypothetical protein